jgi:hypothetical protein
MSVLFNVVPHSCLTYLLTYLPTYLLTYLLSDLKTIENTISYNMWMDECNLKSLKNSQVYVFSNCTRTHDTTLLINNIHEKNMQSRA